MPSMGVGRAEVMPSSIVIKFLTKVSWLGERSDSLNQAMSLCPATDRCRPDEFQIVGGTDHDQSLRHIACAFCSAFDKFAVVYGFESPLRCNLKSFEISV